MAAIVGLSGAELLVQAPLARLLLRLFSERLSGTLELSSTDDAERATIVVIRGGITKLRTGAPVAFLGTVAYELGYIDADELNASLLALSRSKMPHGQVLLERRALSQAQLAAALREQVLRKLTHLLALRTESTVAFHPDTDHLPSYGGADWGLVDPMPAIWRSIRDSVPIDRIRSILARLGGSRYRLLPGAAVERLALQADERALVECLRIKPMTVSELHALGTLPPSTLGLLLYCLLFTGNIEPVAGDVQATSPARPAMPAPSAYALRSAPTVVAPHIATYASRTAAPAAVAPPVAPPITSPPVAPRERSTYERAKACLSNNDLGQAMRLAYTARQADPDSAYPLALLAWVAALQVGQNDVDGVLDSIAALDRALVIDPLCQDALYYRAQLHTRLENHKSAMRDLRTLLEVNPKHADGIRAYRLYQMRIRSGSVRMRAVDPNLISRTTSGIVPKAASVPPGKVRKG